MNKIYFFISLFFLILFSGCSTKGNKVYIKNNALYQDNNNYTSEIDKKSYKHPTMRPYVIRGIRYHPKMVKVGDRFRGIASWYGPDFHGKLTSNGEVYNMHKMTAAHKTLPMNTIVKVKNLDNGKSIIVRINDRGPFVATRIIDLSNLAAKKIGMIAKGTAHVELEVLGFKSKYKAKNHTHKISKTTRKVKDKKQQNYALQIASFSKIDGALKIQQKYDNIDGYKTIIKDVNKNGDRMFKVLLKGFSSADDAREYKTNSKFQNSFIVKEDLYD